MAPPASYSFFDVDHTGATGPLLVSLSPRTMQQPREGSASVDAGTPVAGPWKICPTPKGTTVRGGCAELDHEARSQSEQSLLRRVRADLSFSSEAPGLLAGLQASAEREAQGAGSALEITGKPAAPSVLHSLKSRLRNGPATLLPHAGADEDYQGTRAQAPCQGRCVVLYSEAYAQSWSLFCW